ncbi:MAG: hypothetical protein DWI23_00360 [Planctomycetota bacterium]|nr:MAG: hypothetical protein DWI23_00360 [Planctomycetota bacterium]
MQTIGRSARNVDARVILYADTVTESMRQAINETQRRRALQEAYNAEHGITPQTIRKAIRAGIEAETVSRATAYSSVVTGGETQQRAAEVLEQLEIDMMHAATELDFERAAVIRDRIAGLRTGNESPHPSRGRKGKTGGRGSSGHIPRPKR